MRHMGMGIGHQTGVAALPVDVNMAGENNTISRADRSDDEMSEEESVVDNSGVNPQGNFEEEDHGETDSDIQNYYNSGSDLDSDQELPEYDTL